MMDVAWLLREPSSENVQILASVQMQRFNYLLNILMESRSTIILKRVLSYFENMLAGITDAEMRRQISLCGRFGTNILFRNEDGDEDTEVPHKHNIEFGSTYWEKTSTVPLLDAELALRVKEEQSGKPCGFLVRKTVLTSRTLVFSITGFAVCLGLCATLFHPSKVVSEYRCDLHCSGLPSWLVLYDIHVFATTASQETGQMFLYLPPLHLKKLDNIDLQ
ncbi:hypothetical protein RND71_007897 [Anisodus tanguticus]|uniref:Uncharacterized protein n=1 Tax=Anisodus tanguticus TaxID=243964 RepID=A0AAE1SN63_9SOLA|nr:hypothetical protein RND71_007897 [Anisodus tanguticus]